MRERGRGARAGDRADRGDRRRIRRRREGRARRSPGRHSVPGRADPTVRTPPCLQWRPDDGSTAGAAGTPAPRKRSGRPHDAPPARASIAPRTDRGARTPSPRTAERQIRVGAHPLMAAERERGDDAPKARSKLTDHLVEDRPVHDEPVQEDHHRPSAARVRVLDRSRGELDLRHRTGAHSSRLAIKSHDGLLVQGCRVAASAPPRRAGRTSSRAHQAWPGMRHHPGCHSPPGSETAPGTTPARRRSRRR